MRKLTRKNLEELAMILPVIEQKLLSSYVGGGNGTYEDPYTMTEFNDMADCGRWNGGFVEGLGFVENEIILTPNGCYVGVGSYAAEIAKGLVGLSERSDSDKIKEMLDNHTSYPNGTSNTPWCAAFVSYVYDQAGICNPNSAAVNDWRNWGSATSSPQVGDVAIFNNYSHIGIVAGFTDEGKVIVVHGNSSQNNVKISEMSKSSFTFRTRN